MKIAIIPARGGSKRIPRKNIKLFHGQEMIVYSIKTAIESGVFDKIIVSTDDEEIANIAKKYGAEVPFMRPPELSDDHTATIPVIAHAIENCGAEIDNIDAVCCIYATAPFVQVRYIKSALEKLLEQNRDYVFSGTTFPFPIQRAMKIDKNENISMFQPEHFNTRSQDLEEAYHDAGQFYWGTPEAWLKGTPIFSENSAIVELPRYLVQDIDTLEDFKRAELMYEVLMRDV